MSNELENIDNSSLNTSADGNRRKRGKLLVWLLVALLLASVGGLLLLFHDSGSAHAGLKDAKGKISKLEEQVLSLRSELDTTALNLRRQKALNERLQLENDTFRTLLPIYITKLEVANADSHGNAISSYGKTISASSSMYLMPRITYLGLKVGEKITLNVRLYDNEGKLVTGSSSPKGYSYDCKVDPILPNENMLSLSGWGGGDKGHFRPGSYRYEVWYEDMCLKQHVFTLK